MLGSIPPDRYITVLTYQQRALQIIDDCMNNPTCNGVVIVGGTNYYIESLIFNGDRLSDYMTPHNQSSNAQSSSSSSANDRSSRGIDVNIEHSQDDDMEEKELDDNNFYNYDLLLKKDPALARYVHPNNKRKIKKCFESLQHMEHGMVRMLVAVCCWLIHKISYYLLLFKML